jgi:hypothetical protein
MEIVHPQSALSRFTTQNLSGNKQVIEEYASDVRMPEESIPIIRKELIARILH